MTTEITKCFFCGCIIIPENIPFLTKEIKEYFNKIKVPFTLDYNQSRFKIGNKKICAICERDISIMVSYNMRNEQQDED